MTDHGLQVAPQKSEVVVLTKKWAYTNPVLVMGGYEIPVVKTGKYLGVTLDSRRSFRAHIQKVSGSTKASVNALSILLPNIGGPGIAKRRLLMSAAMVKLIHSATIWGIRGLVSAHNCEALVRPQRQAALRISRCYRSVSDTAALVLAGIPPADLLVNERVRIQERVKGEPTASKIRINFEERKVTFNKWDDKWKKESKAAWTRRLILNSLRWLNRGSRFEVSFHLSQVLSGHGCFNHYQGKELDIQGASTAVTLRIRWSTQFSCATSGRQ